ncbi:MAG: hypothetical protein ACJA00_004409, partial [Myxococcota bacterium]
DIPALAVWPATSTRGTIVYLNHDLLYGTSLMDEPEIGPLFRGATYGAASGH